MAGLFADSFDHYAIGDITQKWNAVVLPSRLSISAGNGRNGTYSLRYATGPDAAGACYVTKGFTAATTVIVGVGFKTSSLAVIGNHPVTRMIQLDYSGVAHISLRLTAAGAIQIYRGTPSTTLLGETVAGLLSDNVYAYIELKVLFSDTVGTVTVRVNSTTALTLGPIDTVASGTVGCNTVHLGHIMGDSFFTLTNDWDDFYLCDGLGAQCNDFLGAVRVYCQLPSIGNGFYAQSTPSTGTDRGAMVDEVQTDGDTTYNLFSAAGLKDTYLYPPLPVGGEVKFVQTNLMLRSAGAGSEQVRPLHRVSGVDYPGTTVGVGTTYADSRSISELSPATGIPWTTTEIDATETGIELVS